MTALVKNIETAYKILKEYNGNNPYIIYLHNMVYAYKDYSLTDFQAEFVIKNKDFEPKEINKIVKIADWWGLKKQEDWKTEFIPEKIKITWYLGETSNVYCFYCVYRRSQEKAIMVFAPKSAIITDFLTPDFHNISINFSPYNEKSGRVLKPYQEEAVQFLIARKKAILASEMGSGKTMASIVAALEGKYKHILIIAPASVKKTWENELSLLVPKEDITIVQGSKWDDAKFTIINYDILDNFYEIPTEKVKKKELDVDDKGNVVTTYKEKEIVSRKKDIIDQAMANSQLFLSTFDLIIIDEAHKLSNTTSGRYKIITDLIKRSNPNGIFELTGTPITNRPINFFNLLKIIGCPISDDWKGYVERYCDGKSFYKKNERNAYTAIFLKEKRKSSWYDLTYEEKAELNAILDKKCKKIWKTDGSSNLEELQERIKPYYLRRLKSDFGKMVEKKVKVLKYDLTDKQKESYNIVWDEYKQAQEGKKKDEDMEKYRAITEGTILRQWLSNEMVGNTIELAKKCIKAGRKVVIFCSFDDELYAIRDAFKDICVIHNGKMLPKKKNEAVEKFQNDPNIKVFIGNINSAGVGITLVAGTVAIFNNFSWVSGDNLQAEDRIYRLNQTKNVTIYYQVFKDTFYEDMFEKVRGKQDIIDNIIVSESKK